MQLECDINTHWSSFLMMCFIPNHFHILNIDLKCKLQTFILLLGERTCIFSRNDYLTIIFFSAVGALWHTSDMAKGGGLCKRSILNLNWSYKTKNDPEINWEKLTEKPYYVSIWCDDNNLENKWSIIYFIKCIIKKEIFIIIVTIIVILDRCAFSLFVCFSPQFLLSLSVFSKVLLLLQVWFVCECSRTSAGGVWCSAVFMLHWTGSLVFL